MHCASVTMSKETTKLLDQMKQGMLLDVEILYEF